jgi:D-aminoacyl-tRNA deacylase
LSRFMRRAAGAACEDTIVRAVVQRVKQASVKVAGAEMGRIETGFLVFLGVARDDTSEDLDYLAAKIINLRAFEDADGRMNRNLQEAGGDMLVVSQFTLLADCRRGRRPSFTDAAAPETAQALYNEFIAGIRQQGILVAAGVFQADMEVSLVNDGPVTFLLDSKKLF